MITDVPLVTPVTAPEVPTVAFALLLLQVPPPVASVNVVAEPVHTDAVPPIAAGEVLMVTVAVTLQPGPVE